MIGEEVRVSRGLKGFVILFLVFALAGMFANKLIQQTVQKQWVGVNEQMVRREIKMASPRIVFSRYGLPSFGAWIDTLSWQKPEDCRTLRLLAKNIFVPIPFFELLLSRPRAGAISVDELIIEHKPESLCEKGPLFANDGSSFLETKDAEEPLTVSLREQIQKYVDDVRKWRQKIPFSKLSVHHIELKNFFVAGKNISGRGVGSFVVSDLLQFQLQLRPLTIQKDKRSITTKFSISAKVDSHDIQTHLDWSYDEGHLLWTSRLDKNNMLNTRFQLENLPLSVVNRWLSTPWTFQFLWANCELELVAKLANLEQQSWTASKCSIQGPKGKIEIQNGTLLSLRNPSDFKVDVLFKDFKIDGAIKGVDKLPLSGVLKTFGSLSGTVHIRNKELDALLSLRGSEVLFSRNNRRVLQEITSMDVATKYAQKKWNIDIVKAHLAQGQFNGVLSAEYDKTTRIWTGKMDILELAFSPAIQDVMLSGTVAPLLLSGSVELGSNKKIKKLDIRGDVKSAVLNGVALSGTHFLIDTYGENIRLSTSVNKVELARGEKWDWLFASLLAQATLTEKMAISRAYGEIILEQDQFTIKKMFGTAFNGRFNMSGVYGVNAQKGTLEWLLPQREYAWDWERENGQALLSPRLELMKNWLFKNKDFIKEFQSVRIVESKVPEAG